LGEREEPKDMLKNDDKKDFSNGQAEYDLTAAVDPNDENTVYVGGLDLHKSSDGARSWDQISVWRKFAINSEKHLCTQTIMQ